jgi:hypothetical protein
VHRWLRLALAASLAWIAAIPVAFLVGVAALAIPAVPLLFFLPEAPVVGEREDRTDGRGG